MKNILEFSTIWIAMFVAAFCVMMGPWRALAMLLHLPPIRNLIIGQAMPHPYTHIYDKDGSRYMGRWWVLKERDWFPWAIRLHAIERADRDRHYHDHPYDYRTIILSGGYLEDSKTEAFRWWAAGNTVARDAAHYHRILKVDPSTYTLFIYRYRKESNGWGFLVDGVKVPWQEYTTRK